MNKYELDKHSKFIRMKGMQDLYITTFSIHGMDLNDVGYSKCALVYGLPGWGRVV